MPPLPTAALFVSNHGVDDQGRGVGGAAPDSRRTRVWGALVRRSVRRRELPLRAPRLPEGAPLEAARAQETAAPSSTRESALARGAAWRFFIIALQWARADRARWGASLCVWARARAVALYGVEERQPSWSCATLAASRRPAGFLRATAARRPPRECARAPLPGGAWPPRVCVPRPGPRDVRMASVLLTARQRLLSGRRDALPARLRRVRGNHDRRLARRRSEARVRSVPKSVGAKGTFQSERRQSGGRWAPALT